MKSPFVRDPAPFVTRWRSRTVANVDSITLLVRRCFQCSAGNSKKVTRTSASLSSVAIAFEYFAPYSVANRVMASRACSRVSAYITSWSAPSRAAEGASGACRGCCRACGTSPVARGSSATRRVRLPRSRARRRPPRRRARSCPGASGRGARSSALRALAVAVLDREHFLRPVWPHADHHESAEQVVLQPDVEVDAVDPHVDVVAVGEAPLLEGPVLPSHSAVSRAMFVADSPAASFPRSAASASRKPPVERPRR